MEIIGPSALLPVVETIGNKFQLPVQQIGTCETSLGENQLQIVSEVGTFEFS